MSKSQGAVALAHAPRSSRRADRFDQREVLLTALGQLAGPRRIAVFDLDSTLLDNRPRQSRILRELGERVGDARLVACQDVYWSDWEIETAMRACGLNDREVAQLAPQAKSFWQDRFFTSDYCRDDIAHAGAASYLMQVTAADGIICYVTGRHTEMGHGTLEAFERAGFPRPNGTRVHLLLKPRFQANDDEWKVTARKRLAELGEVGCAFDNEPVHINSYRLGFPDASVVHLDTDHSGRPVEVLPEIPSVRDFVL